MHHIHRSLTGAAVTAAVLLIVGGMAAAQDGSLAPSPENGAEQAESG